MKKILFTIAIVMLMVGIGVGAGITQTISISPERQDFGNIMMGNSSSPQGFILSNSGAANLLVTSIELSGGDSRMFSLDPGTCASLTPTIQGGGSCTIDATFSPNSGGLKSTTLKIISNASNSPVAGVALTGTGLQPINVGLVLDKTTYNSADPINVVLTLQNPGSDLITSKGFKDRTFHLFLMFTDPDGNVITSNLLRDTDLQDPGPPRVFVLPSGKLVPNLEPVETVEKDWVLSITIPNAHDYYPLSKGGSYSVKAVIPMRTYPGIDYTDNQAVPPVNYSLIDNWNSQGALESNIVNFALEALSLDSIKITPSSSTITAGGSQSYTATGYDTNKNSLGDVTAGTTFSIAPNFSCTGSGCGSCEGSICTATRAGAYNVTATYEEKMDTATLGVYGTTSIMITPGTGSGSVTVTVNSSAGTPGGNVALSVDGGSAVSQLLSSGSATFTVGTLGAGNHTLNATYDTQGYFYGSSATGNLSGSKLSQTITVTQGPPDNAVYNTSFSVAATASSGLAVSISASGACTIQSRTVTMTSGTGTCSITFDQAGSSAYNAAAQVARSVTAQKANQTITFNPLPNKTYGDPPFALSASASSGLPVSFSIVSGPATISNSLVTITGVGTVTVRASQTGNTSWNPATSVDQSFQVAPRPPVALCQNVTVSAGPACTAPASINNGSYDPNGYTITPTQSPAGPYPLGNTTVTLTVIDSKGLSSQCTGSVIVNDNTPPSITAPGPVTAYTGPTGTSCGTTNVTLRMATASDNCPGVSVIQSGVPSGGFFPVGMTTITYTAKDAAGNVATATQTVTVIDNTPPTISAASASPSTLWPPNHKMVNVAINYSAIDNCGTPTCKISGVTSNEPISSSDYAILDAHHVNLTADRLGSGTGRIYTVTITCTDASGNSSNQAVTVTVPHDQGK